MPEGQTNDKLAEEFATFFLEKIQNTHDKFTRIEFKPSTNQQVPLLRTFLPLSCKEILSMNNKTCEVDDIPTETLKRILPAILGTIAAIVNLSLSTGSFAHEWKTAVVKPLLKKSGLDLLKKKLQACL